MDWLPELQQRETRLKSLVAQWNDGAPDAQTTAIHAIAVELAETQMVLERHIAEMDPPQRSVERYFLEFQLPTFTYLKQWYELFQNSEDGAGATLDDVTRPRPSR